MRWKRKAPTSSVPDRPAPDTCRTVTSPREFVAVDRFLAEHIPDPTRLSILQNFRFGLRGDDDLILVIEDDQGIAGAAFSGPPWQEAALGIAEGWAQPATAEAMRHGAWMLHDVAVRPDVRRQRVGVALVAGAVEHAKALGRDAVFGVGTGGPGVWRFYKQMGFEISSDEEMLVFHPVSGGRGAGLPIDRGQDNARWFLAWLTQSPQLVLVLLRKQMPANNRGPTYTQ